MPSVAAKEEILARLTGRSHGVVTWQALLVIHRGGFRIGHAAPSPEARYLAAVKASGPDALLAGGPLRISPTSSGIPPSSPEVLTSHHRRPAGMRERRARKRGDRFRRYTWTDVSERPAQMSETWGRCSSVSLSWRPRRLRGASAPQRETGASCGSGSRSAGSARG